MNDRFSPVFFASPTALRGWFEKHHRTARELWVGFYKKHTGRPTVTWSEAVDEALCFGWIDGIRKSLDAESYTNRFTPRQAGSVWSAINTRRADELIRARRMRAAGRKAYQARDVAKTTRLETARAVPRLDAGRQRRFMADHEAWKFFRAQPPGYRRMAIWWVISAKRDETRDRRLQALIAMSGAGRRLEPMKPPAS